jgi:hypothetical protein
MIIEFFRRPGLPGIFGDLGIVGEPGAVGQPGELLVDPTQASKVLGQTGIVVVINEELQLFLHRGEICKLTNLVAKNVKLTSISSFY